MKNLTVAITILVFAAPVGARDRSPALRLPYHDYGACPFECCVYRRWAVVKDTIVHASRSEISHIAFRLRKGEHVQAITGVVITTEPGVAVALRPTVAGGRRVPTGGWILILTNLGEGYAKVSYRGRVAEAQVYDESAFKIERQAKSVWWVKLRDRHERIGWSNEVDDYGDNDACG